MMSERYKTKEKEKGYFVTFTITEWEKILLDDDFKIIVTDAIRHCQQNRGLLLYAYCIMPNHVHLIVRSEGNESVSQILRDLKKHTSKEIVSRLQASLSPESKRMLAVFKAAGDKLKRIKGFKVWIDGNRPVVLFSNKFIWQKLQYIHENPVGAGLASGPLDYKFSSARNYAEMEGVLDVHFIDPPVRTYR